MKHYVFAFAVLAVSFFVAVKLILSPLLGLARKSSSSGDRIKQLEDENARLRRAAGQSAALVPATEEPPQDVIDDTARGQCMTARGFKVIKKNFTGYKVINNYTRQLKDETFHVYDFEIDCIGYPPAYMGDQPGTEYKIKVTLGFVKRGKQWETRQWRKDD